MWTVPQFGKGALYLEGTEFLHCDASPFWWGRAGEVACDNFKHAACFWFKSVLKVAQQVVHLAVAR